MKPGPAISTFATSSGRGQRGDEGLRERARIGARGLGQDHRGIGGEVAVRAVWFGRSTTKAGMSRSWGSVPAVRRAAMPWSTRAWREAFTTDAGGRNDGRIVYGTHQKSPRAAIDRGGPSPTIEWSSRRMSSSRSDARISGVVPAIVVARFGRAAGVVVADDHGRCVEGQRASRDLARVDVRLVHGAVEEFLEGEHPQPRVEEHRGEDFRAMVAQAAVRRTCRRRAGSDIGSPGIEIGGVVAMAEFQRGQPAGRPARGRCPAVVPSTATAGPAMRAASLAHSAGGARWSRRPGRAGRSRGRGRATRRPTARRHCRGRRVFRVGVRGWASRGCAWPQRVVRARQARVSGEWRGSGKLDA